MSAIRVHLGLYKRGVFGGVTNTSLCNRLRDGLQDGLNTTTDPAGVTCKFCLGLIGSPLHERMARINAEIEAEMKAEGRS